MLDTAVIFLVRFIDSVDGRHMDPKKVLSV